VIVTAAKFMTLNSL